MKHFTAFVAGKATSKLMRLRGGGSALPGLVAERIEPEFAIKPLSKLPQGVVVISGTNGKTTTAKIVSELLQANGLRVFTNSSGSNFMRGVISELLQATSLTGKLPYDIAILELDEAHAVPFVKLVKPKVSLLLNVFPDQTDRFKDTKTVARLLHKVASATTDTIIFNREDLLLRKISEVTPKSKTVQYFGLGTKARPAFGIKDIQKVDALESIALLNRYKSPDAQFTINGKNYRTNLALPGPHNAYNSAAALALVMRILGDKVEPQKLVDQLSLVEPASGRGEQFTVDGKLVELVLVKNLVGFQMVLDHYDPKGYATMIAMNNAFADGRDTDWLNDIDFKSLQKQGVSYVSGTQADKLTKILNKQEVNVSHKNDDPLVALKRFIGVNQNKHRRIYCSYTAMVELREEIAHLAD